MPCRRFRDGGHAQRATRHIAYMYTLGIQHVPRLRAAANAVHMDQLSMPRAALLRTNYALV
jgi:hypothetical protein